MRSVMMKLKKLSDGQPLGSEFFWGALFPWCGNSGPVLRYQFILFYEATAQSVMFAVSLFWNWD